MKPSDQIRSAQKHLKQRLIENVGPEVQKAVSEFCEETGLTVQEISFRFTIMQDIDVEHNENMLSNVEVIKDEIL